jgi:hypothetical protein
MVYQTAAVLMVLFECEEPANGFDPEEVSFHSPSLFCFSWAFDCVISSLLLLFFLFFFHFLLLLFLLRRLVLLLLFVFHSVIIFYSRHQACVQGLFVLLTQPPSQLAVVLKRCLYCSPNHLLSLLSCSRL